jgi:ferric iron reductase protein FhuF
MSESAFALVVSYWAKCMNIAAAESLPAAEREAAYTALLQEAMAPVIRAMDSVQNVLGKLH